VIGLNNGRQNHGGTESYRFGATVCPNILTGDDADFASSARFGKNAELKKTESWRDRIIGTHNDLFFDDSVHSFLPCFGKSAELD
jgi:hypothetical protein